MSRKTAQIAFLQALTLVLLASPFLAAGIYVWQKHIWAQASLEQLEPRHARLQGVQAMLPELTAATARAQATLNQHSYPATQDATKAGNDAQQRIRTLFEASQLTINSLQVLPPKDSERFQSIAISLQVEGTLAEIQAALLKLRDDKPSIQVDSFSLQSTGPVRPASTQRVAGSFGFSVLRAKS